MVPTGRVEGDSASVDVLGVRISAINMPMALSTIERWIESAARQYVCVTGVHGVMESQRDTALLEIHNRAGLVTPDGMPLVWISHARGMKHVRRVYGPDLLDRMFSARSGEMAGASSFSGAGAAFQSC